MKISCLIIDCMDAYATQILLVDDEPVFRGITEIMLRQQGYVVACAASGEEARRLLRSDHFDAVLLDLILPDCDGMDLAGELSRLHPYTAVIILTGMASIDSAVRSMRFGISDYLHKPCAPAELTRVIDRAVENKSLKRELIESRRKFQQLADATWEGIVFFGQDGIIQTNRQLAEMFGYAEDELPGRDLADLFEHWRARVLMRLPGGQTGAVALEMVARHKSGGKFLVEARVKATDDGAFVAAVRDISERKQAERRALRMEERLRGAERMENIGLMVGGVAHDLNNILTSIVTYPELLMLDLPEGDKYHHDLEEIRAAGQQAAAIVADLLTVARGATTAREPRQLNQIIEEARGSIEMRVLRKDYPQLRFTFRLADDLPRLLVSELHIRQSFLNLLRNSAEASRGLGEIVVTTGRRLLKRGRALYEKIPPGEYAILSIEDEGEGIAPADLPRIFEPFYSKKEMGRSGTGLGLAIVINTMRDHRGYVDVVSSERGSRFTLYFPVAAIAEERMADEVGCAVTPPRGQGEVVLVVDDDQQQLAIVSSILQRLGYKAFQADTSERAMSLLNSRPVDMIILDKWMEEGVNGFDVFKRIKTVRPDQRVVMASGYLSPEDLAMAERLGIGHCLAKPFSMNSLATVIQDELRKPQ
ncbi:MAG: response regulator [Desulfobulbaceae bacterium]|jgi:PAS domain S-box-containing protein|nr:response regulator [Desulfobulbaceae bacterium]